MDIYMHRIIACLLWMATVALSQEVLDEIRASTLADTTGYVGFLTTLHCPVTFDNSGNLNYIWYKYDYTVDSEGANPIENYRVAFYQKVLTETYMIIEGILEDRADVDPVSGDLRILSATLNDTYMYVCKFVPGGYGRVNLTVIDEEPPVSGGWLKELGGIGIVFGIIVPIVLVIVIAAFLIAYCRRKHANKLSYDKKFHGRLPKNKKRDPDVIRETPSPANNPDGTVVYTEVEFPNSVSPPGGSNRLNQPVPPTRQQDHVTIYSEVAVPRRT